MEAALDRIAALAPSLKEAELRIILELSQRADEQNACSASSRDLARAARLSRSHVVSAIDSLAERGLIAADGGSATRASSYHLAFLETAVLVERGLLTGPPPPKQVVLFGDQGGPVRRPGVVPERDQGGLIGGPPPIEERARAGAAHRSNDSTQILDRLLRANPKKHDDELLSKARNWLYGYMRKFSRELEPHPPDAQIVAQFLSVAEWPRLEALLNKLAREQCEAGSRYAWFVQVALQRIHGLSLADVRERRAQLQIAGRAPEARPDAVVQQALDLQAELRQVAAAKAMR